MNYYNGFSSVVQKVRGKYRITIVGTIVGFLEVLNEVKKGVCRRTPDRIRTCALRIRNPLLYPAELPGHGPNLIK